MTRRPANQQVPVTAPDVTLRCPAPPEMPAGSQKTGCSSDRRSPSRRTPAHTPPKARSQRRGPHLQRPGSKGVKGKLPGQIFQAKYKRRPAGRHNFAKQTKRAAR
jgi:hypothetical protein